MTTYRVSKRGSIQRDGRNVHRDASERLHRNNAEAGFTLLELLVVLIILGLIAAVVAGPQVFKLLGTAKSEAAGVQIERIGGALDLFRLEVGRYPTQEENLGALVESPPGLDNWNGPYLKKSEFLLDPWGRQFVYRIPGEHLEYDLYSLGSDNIEGGEGESQDITNW
ncbi:MAG: type II secretion system major pseudopilin GspG [Hyphomicrobiales bacterium]|nr:type II secretion system major pseudopilin GspG [Hyphomicrobiales bacterium]